MIGKIFLVNTVIFIEYCILYIFIKYCYLPCNIPVSLFVLMATLTYLKPKVHNFATISAFALFLLHGFTYSIGCIVLS